MKAKYIGKVKDKNGYTVHLFYEYRGREYMITDYGWYAATNQTLAVQHKQEQERIDREIEEAAKPVKEWTYEGSGEEGFKVFWDYVEGE